MDKTSAPPATHLGGPRYVPEQGLPASRRRRLAAMLYEVMLMVGVLGFAFLVPQVGYSMATKHAAAPWALLVHVYLVMGIYFVWYWRRTGQTLSMQTWRIKLVDASVGGGISLGQGLLRYSLAWPSLLFFGAGVVWSFFDRDGQFLHDRLAGTRVIFFDPRATN